MKRQLVRWPKRSFQILAFALVAFQIWTAALPISSIEQRCVHVGLAILLILLIFKPHRNESSKAFYFDMLLGIIAVAAVANMFFRYEWFLTHPGESGWLDLILGGALFVIVIEICRRTNVWALIVLMVTLLLYAVFGDLIPGSFGHRGFGLIPLIQQMYQSTRGIWGSITTVSATTLAIFIIYGTYIGSTGAGDLFMKMATKLVGRVRGGPPLVAVGSSALVGTISGSAMANVVISGTLTIPTMKRLGYKPAYAGAVEAVASTGGQLMPPIMGAGAFLMAELLGVGYPQIVAAALIPALAFYAMCVSAVMFRAVKQNHAPVPKEDIPSWTEVLVWGQLIPFLASIVVLIAMFVKGFSTEFAGFAALATLVLLYLFQDLKPRALLKRIKHMMASTEEAALAIISIIPIILAASIILGLMNQTGMPVKISETISGLAEQSIWIGMMVAAFITLILGMGLPTAGAYLLAATMIAPSIVAIGFAPIAAHLFIFYFAILSAVTPPVCVAVFATLPLSGATLGETSKESILLAPLIYLLPILFLFAPGLLMEGSLLTIVLTSVPVILGMMAVTGAVQPGRSHHAVTSPAMLLLLIGGILLLASGFYGGEIITLLVGLTLSGIGFLLWRRLSQPSLSSVEQIST